MQTTVRNIFARLTIIFLVIFSFLTVSGYGQTDWTKIKEFKFYGFDSPTENKDAKYVLADTDKIKKIFSNLVKSDGFLPKGASRFATITFEDNEKITIEIIAGGHLPFRVIKKDIWTDNWFDFPDNNTATEWTTYITELTDKLEK